MNYKDISIGQYVELYSILTNTELEQDERLLYLCMLFDSNILQKPISEFKRLSNELITLLREEPIKETVKDKYKINGTVYRLHKDFGTLTTSQFIDFQNYLKDGFELQDYCKVLSVFLIPDGETYNNGNYDIKQLQNDIDNHLSITDALSISAFFLQIGNTFLECTQKYLRHKMKKWQKEIEKKNQK